MKRIKQFLIKLNKTDRISINWLAKGNGCLGV